MNQRKIFGTLAGFVILAGISYHQVRDAGPDPRDTAIMSGTVVSGQVAERRADTSDADSACDSSGAGRENGSGVTADCRDDSN